jgi:hypothetical protein
LVVAIAEKVERFLARHGYGPSEDVEEFWDEDAQLAMQAASLAGRAALGLRAGRKVRRYQVLGGRRVKLPPKCAICDGYNLHAGVVVRDVEARERLCRTIGRPPLAKSRLELRDDGAVVLRLKRAWSNGTSAFVFSPLEFLERLAALIPPPRFHQIHYHGVLASRSSWRRAVIPKAPIRESNGSLSRGNGHPCQTSERRFRWGDLLKRVFGVDSWSCPTCFGRMKLRAVIIYPPATG